MFSIRNVDDVQPIVTRDRMTEAQAAKYSDDELASVQTSYFPHEGESLELFQLELAPDTQIGRHAHRSAEVVYVLKGELKFGALTARAGAAVFVDAMTLYAFRAGPEGCTFLNFRGVPGGGILTPEELRAERAEAPTSTPAVLGTPGLLSDVTAP